MVAEVWEGRCAFCGVDTRGSFLSGYVQGSEPRVKVCRGHLGAEWDAWLRVVALRRELPESALQAQKEKT